MSETIGRARPAHQTVPEEPRLPAPPELVREPGRLAFLYGLATDPLALWTREHFDELALAKKGVLGDTVTFSDPAAIKHVLVDNWQNYRKDRIQQNILRPLLGDSVLNAEGESWKRQRRIMAPLFTPRRIEAFAAPMRAVAEEVVDEWAGQAARGTAVVRVDHDMAHLALGVLSRTIFSGAGPEPKAVTDAVGRYLLTAGRVDPLDVLGAPSFIPRIGRLRSRPAMRELLGLVNGMVAEGRKAAASQPGVASDASADLLTALLKARDPETGEGLDDESIRVNVLTILAAGHETTANALTWTLLMLALHPGIRADCEAEADAAGPEAGEDELPLVRAVIEESMRLYPPASVITRAAVDTDRAGGVDIPAGALVIMSPWLVHRHRALWSEPGRFRPERFLPENRGAIPRFAYLPFGAGPRVCIGAAFAMQEAVIALAAILRRVRLDLPPGAKPPMPTQRITLRPKGGMRMVVRAR
jgi:cytochrome P450